MVATTTTKYKRTMYHATFEGAHGWALRDEHGVVYFYGDDGSTTLLHNEDAAALQLHGHVQLSAYQHHLDDTRAQAERRARTTTTRPTRRAA